jgi:hypothetical protein
MLPFVNSGIIKSGVLISSDWFPSLTKFRVDVHFVIIASECCTDPTMLISIGSVWSL